MPKKKKSFTPRITERSVIVALAIVLMCSVVALIVKKDYGRAPQIGDPVTLSWMAK